MFNRLILVPRGIFFLFPNIFYCKNTWQIFPKIVKLVEFALETQNCTPKNIQKWQNLWGKKIHLFQGVSLKVGWTNLPFNWVCTFTFVYKKKDFQRKLMILNPPSRLGVCCEASLIASFTCKELHKTFFSCLASQGDALLSYDQGPRKMASPFTFPLALPSIKGTPALQTSNFFICLANFFVFFPMWVSCDIYIYIWSIR